MIQSIETYHTDYLDSLLDKINKSGIDSLTDVDRDFLNAYSSGDEDKMSYIEKTEGQKLFVSSDRYFTFKYSHLEDIGEEGIRYYGTLSVPSLDLGSNVIEGELYGYIWTLNGQSIPVFEKGNYDVLEFCNGLEYELDSFLDYVIFTIEDENPVK